MSEHFKKNIVLSKKNLEIYKCTLQIINTIPLYEDVFAIQDDSEEITQSIYKIVPDPVVA